MKDLSKVGVRSELMECIFKKTELLRDIKNYNMLKYLPVQNENETDKEYEERKKNVYFYNKMDKNINIFSSKPFKSDFQIKSENPEIEELEKNFNGSNITATDFLKNVLKYSLWFSQSHMFVDLSEKKKHIVSLVELSEILDFECDDEGYLKYLRFRTEEQVREGFTVNKYKVVKEYIKDDNNNVIWNDYISQNIAGYKSTDNLTYKERNIDQPFGLLYIPLVSYYPSSSLDPFNPDLIFRNAAEIQVIQYRSASRMKNTEYLLNTPTMVWSEVEVDAEEDRMVQFGEKRAIALQTGRIEWLKAPIESLVNQQDNIKVLNDQIDDLMGDVLYGKTNGSATATENVLNASNTNTFLASVANSLQYTAEEIINIILDWKSVLNKDFSTSIVTDFTVAPDATKVTNLLNLKLNSVISGRTVFEECKNMAVFSPDTEWEEEQLEIQKEVATSLGDFQSITDEPTNEETQVESVVEKQEESIDENL